MALLEEAHHLAEPDGFSRPSQPDAAAGPALRGDEATAGQVLHHLGEMVVGNQRLFRNAQGGQEFRRLARQPHQNPQSIVGEGCETHGVR